MHFDQVFPSLCPYCFWFQDGFGLCGCCENQHGFQRQEVGSHQENTKLCTVPLISQNAPGRSLHALNTRDYYKSDIFAVAFHAFYQVQKCRFQEILINPAVHIVILLPTSQVHDLGLFKESSLSSLTCCDV